MPICHMPDARPQAQATGGAREMDEGFCFLPSGALSHDCLQKEGCSFLKKRTKKLLRAWAYVDHLPFELGGWR
jgi:hypothetical protein